MDTEAILLGQISDLGVVLPDGAKTCADLTADVLYQVVARGMSGAVSVPPTLPATTSQRCRACGVLASAMKVAGYPDDIAYNNILYPSADETRGILSWVLSRVAADGASGERGDAAVDVSSLPPSVRRGLSVLAQQRADSGAGPTPRKTVCRFTTHAPAMLSLDAASLAQSVDEEAFVRANVKIATRQCPTRRSAVCTMVEYMAAMRSEGAAKQFRSMMASSSPAGAFMSMSAGGGGVLSESQQDHDADVAAVEAPPSAALPSRVLYQAEVERGQQRQDAAARRAAADELKEEGDTVAGVMASVEGEEQDVAATLEKLQSALEACHMQRCSLEAKRQDQDSTVAELERRLQELEGETEEVQKKLQHHVMLCEYLQDPATSIAALEEEVARAQASVDEQRNAYEQKRKKWEGQTEQLQASLRELAESTSHTEEIEAAQEKTRALKSLLKQKEEEVSTLSAMLEHRMRKDGVDPEAASERANFTRKLLDMMRHVRKQQLEIDKNAENIHKAMEELSLADEERERTFRQVEVAIYRETTKGDFPRAVYKRLVSLREAFEMLQKHSTQRHEMKMEKQSVEERSAKLLGKVQGLDIQRVEADLADVLRENEVLSSGGGKMELDDL